MQEWGSSAYDAAATPQCPASAWAALDEELSYWRKAGRTATLWWRDDDAARRVPALDELLDMSARHSVPLALAVIPAALEPSLPARIACCPGVTVLQHGYAHRDYAASDEPGAELGEHRSPGAVLGELALGMERLRKELGTVSRPVLVPPWNRIAPSLLPGLAGLGFTGLSCFSPRERARTRDGVLCVNCHVDPVDWRSGAAFRGEEWTLGSLIRHLRGRRTGAVDPVEPTGLLTHHLCHDRELWSFLDDLFRHTVSHAAVRWLNTDEVFAP